MAVSLQIGAAAFMAGATRMTLTTTVMVMETTGAMQLIVPLMITVFVAKVPVAHVMSLLGMTLSYGYSHFMLDLPA